MIGELLGLETDIIIQNGFVRNQCNVMTAQFLVSSVSLILAYSTNYTYLYQQHKYVVAWRVDVTLGFTLLQSSDTLHATTYVSFIVDIEHLPLITTHTHTHY